MSSVLNLPRIKGWALTAGSYVSGLDAIGIGTALAPVATESGNASLLILFIKRKMRIVFITVANYCIHESVNLLRSYLKSKKLYKI